MKPKLDTCIAIPTINELSNLKVLLPELRRIFPDALILIIDDGSTDGTTEYIEGLQLIQSGYDSISRSTRLGIGSAHILGMQYARQWGFKYLITLDGDLTHRCLDVERVFEQIEDSELVIGSRYLKDSEIVGWSNFRLALTSLGHLATCLFFHSNLDMSSGLRVYRVDYIPFERIVLNCPSNYEFFFISALIYLRSDLRISEVPITLLERNDGKSKMTIGLMLAGIFKLLLFGMRFRKLNI